METFEVLVLFRKTADMQPHYTILILPHFKN